MSSLTKIILASVLTTVFGSGCCMTSTCMMASCDLPGAPGCGAAAYVEPGCGAAGGGCQTAGCRPGGCLGLGCLGKLFSIAHYGCNGCASGYGTGCGGNYYHDWISDPPCAEPCDGCGNYTGIAGEGVCGSCTGASCGVPAPSCGAATYVEPSCGIANCGGCDGCGGGGGGLLGHGGFQIPGRMIYSTLGGVGGFFKELHRGLLPSHGACNAFSSYPSGCSSCGGCDSCIVEPGCGVETVVATAAPPARGLAKGQIPHNVVSRQIQTAHNRPPHKVVSKHLR